MPHFLHIWQADLTTSHPSWPVALATLSTYEQSRQARLRTHSLRHTYGRAHGFLRAVLEMYVSQQARTLDVYPDAAGKPQLPGTSIYRTGRGAPSWPCLTPGRSGPISSS